MTEIEKKALALINEVRRAWGMGKPDQVSINRDDIRVEALCRAIKQHEQFRREVSDAVGDALPWCEPGKCTSKQQRDNLSRFIIAKPDPLAECLDQMLRRRTLEPAQEVIADEAAWLRAALAKRGLQVTEIER